MLCQVKLIVLELSSRHLSVEQQIQLLKRPSHCLGDTEVCPEEAQRRQTAKEETQLSLHVGLVRVDHVWDANGHHDTNNSLRCSSHSN